MKNQDKNNEVNISQSYEYDPSMSLWDCVKNTAKIIFSQLLNWILIVYYALRSTILSKRDKVKILAALVYLLLRSDFISDAIPVVGLIDDVALLWVVFRLLVVIDDSIKAQAAERVRRWFGWC